jgi:hypothetical protein
MQPAFLTFSRNHGAPVSEDADKVYRAGRIFNRIRFFVLGCCSLDFVLPVSGRTGEVEGTAESRRPGRDAELLGR